jgi:hypothetical protein
VIVDRLHARLHARSRARSRARPHARSRARPHARSRALAFAGAALGLALSLTACGDTLQDKKIAPQLFESVIVKSRFPVYWVGLRFAKLAVTNVAGDPGGAVAIQYGDCVVGGQYTCVTPLSIVTSPDNSFVPGGSVTSSRLALRGVRVVSSWRGTVLALATGGVVVSVYARTPALARAAAQTMIPFNRAVVPSTRLPGPAADTGFDRRPLPSQLPPGAG